MDEARDSPPQPSDGRRSDGRAAAVALALGIVVGFVALLAKLGRYRWFHGDEWQYLANRDGGDLRQLIEPHNEHLNTVPILVWRAMFRAWGMSSYVPYQIPVIAAHLAVVAMLWLIIRRCGVHPWIATAAAAVFILYGPGEENIVWAFQIGFTGSLALGLGHLLLADHDGPLGRRDAIGVALGLVGLLSSGFTPVITAVITVVVLVRRGWRPALFHSVPLAVVYLGWWLAIGPTVLEDPYARSTDFAEIVNFIWVAGVATFDGIGGGRPLAILWALALPTGMIVAWRGAPRRAALERLVLPLALLGGGFVFLALSGYGRWWISDNVGSSSRYVHLSTAFALPALAVAIDAVVRHWRGAVAAACLLLVAAIPSNVDAFGETADNEQYFDFRESFVIALADSPFGADVPPDTRPDPIWTPVSIGWLRELRADGRLPEGDPPPNPADALLFGLAQVPESTASTSCPPLTEPVDVTLRRGDELQITVGPFTEPKDGWFFHQSFTVQLLVDGEPIGRPYLRSPASGERLVTLADELDVRIGLFGLTEAIGFCGP